LNDAVAVEHRSSFDLQLLQVAAHVRSAFSTIEQRKQVCSATQEHTREGFGKAGVFNVPPQQHLLLMKNDEQIALREQSATSKGTATISTVGRGARMPTQCGALLKTQAHGA
jgi:hypothetical protein